VIGSTATLAIAASRARALWLPACALVFLSVAAGAGSNILQTSSVRIVSNVVFTALVAIAVAYLNGRAMRNDPFAAVEEAAPLFGRQWARANAIFPTAVVLLCSAAQYAVPLWLRDHAALTFFAINAIAALTALPIALSVPLRSQWNGVLYAALSIVGALFCTAFGAAMLQATRNGAIAVSASAGLALILVFLALRQYGEALARYDPVPRVT